MSGKLGPYELNTIIHGDCLEVMPHLPDRSVDMLLSDWPYGTTACEWDSIIPLEPLWEQCKRVIKPGGAIVLTASQPFTSVLVMSNLDWFKYEWVWKKNSPRGYNGANVKPLGEHENICIFSSGTVAPGFSNNMIYIPQGLQPYGKVNRRSRRGETTGERPNQKDRYTQEFTNYPRTVLEFDTETGLHPTQKPVALFAYLIRTYSNPGDLILDNAAGSCTTAIAAIETGRNWLCIEKKAEYVKIGRERVAERLAQPFLPGVIETALPQPVQLDLGVSDG